MDNEVFLKVEEVAAAAKVSQETVRRWLRSSRLPGRLIGGTRAGYRIKQSDVRRFLEGESFSRSASFEER